MKTNASKDSATQIVICVENTNCTASLEKRKIYVVLADAQAAELGMLRVIDESGEDYLYPRTLFVQVELKPAVKRAVLAA